MRNGREMNSIEEKTKGVRMKDVEKFINENTDEIITNPNAFADYMRSLIKEKRLSQQEVFLNADIPERYGYKLISQEKHTKQRDIILRICYAAKFTLEETQEALRLYQMPELYKYPRDVAIMIAFQERPGDILDVNSILKSKGFEPLRSSGTIN